MCLIGMGAVLRTVSKSQRTVAELVSYTWKIQGDNTVTLMHGWDFFNVISA